MKSRYLFSLLTLGACVFFAGTPSMAKSGDDNTRKAKKEAKEEKKKDPKNTPKTAKEKGGSAISEEDMEAARQFITTLKEEHKVTFAKKELLPALQMLAHEELSKMGFPDENILSPVELAYYTYI